MSQTKRGLVAFMADDSGLNAFGINTDPKLAVQQVTDKTLTITTDVDKVDSGVILETFSITVKGKVKETVEDSEGKVVETEVEKTFYQSDNQPFGWNKLSAFPEIFASKDAELNEVQMKLLPDVFSGEKQGEVLLALLNLWNANERDKAKANEYARIMGIFKPVSAEDRDKAKENMVKNFAKGFGVSLDEARKTLKEKGLI